MDCNQSANERAAHWARENSEKQRLFDEAIAQRDAAEARLAQPELKAEGFEELFRLAAVLEEDSRLSRPSDDWNLRQYRVETRPEAILRLQRLLAALPTKSGLGEELDKLFAETSKGVWKCDYEGSEDDCTPYIYTDIDPAKVGGQKDCVHILFDADWATPEDAQFVVAVQNAFRLRSLGESKDSDSGKGEGNGK